MSTVYRASDWESITVQLNGVTLVDLESVEFGGGSEIAVGYGKGRRPRRYAKKNVDAPTGKLKMALEEYVLLLENDQITERGLYGDNSFEIVMVRETADSKDFTVELLGCQFTSDKLSDASQDTEGVMVELDFICLGGRTQNGVPDLA
jgi:hypothetical protein